MNLRSLTPLQIALGVSIGIHALALTLRFVDPETFNRVFEDTPLEVILVNAHTNERPLKARAIAQANMGGGGQAERARATSPLPPSMLSEVGEETEEQIQRQLQQMREQQNQLLTQIKRQLATLAPPEPRQASVSADQLQREEKRRQLIKLLAEIERRINLENSRPRKRYISPSTREEVYAIYYDHLRRTIEDKGTENFPEIAGKKLYGELTMGVTVNFDGHIHKIELVESSGNRALDRRAEAIVRSAGPFGRFSPAMRHKAEQIWVVSRFKFTREETLETKLSAN